MRARVRFLPEVDKQLIREENICDPFVALCRDEVKENLNTMQLSEAALEGLRITGKLNEIISCICTIHLPLC